MYWLVAYFVCCFTGNPIGCFYALIIFAHLKMPKKFFWLYAQLNQIWELFFFLTGSPLFFPFCFQDHFLQKYTENVVCISNDRLSYHLDDSSQQEGCITVPGLNGEFEHASSITYFENKKVRYLWDKNQKEFCRVKGLDKDLKCTYFYTQKGLSSEEQKRRFEMK